MLSDKRAIAIRPTFLVRLAFLLVEAILQARLAGAESLGQIPMGREAHQTRPRALRERIATPLATPEALGLSTLAASCRPRLTTESCRS
jgi:hypothetical protein